MDYIVYNDVLTFLPSTVTSYGDEVAGEASDVACALQAATGWRHANNEDVISADSIAFVDPQDQFLLDNGFRLEGMKCYQLVFGSQVWYRVTSVIIARETQFQSDVDNVQLTLKKTSAPVGGIS